MGEYHKCNNCGKITYNFDGYIEMNKHTKKCKKKENNMSRIICLFTTYKL